MHPETEQERYEDWLHWAEQRDAEARAAFDEAWKWVLLFLVVGALIWRG